MLNLNRSIGQLAAAQLFCNHTLEILSSERKIICPNANRQIVDLATDIETSYLKKIPELR